MGRQVNHYPGRRFISPIPVEERVPLPAPDWFPLTSPGGSPAKEVESAEDPFIDNVQSNSTVPTDQNAGNSLAPAGEGNALTGLSNIANSQEPAQGCLGYTKVSKMHNLSKRSHNNTHGKPNRPWLFEYTFAGSNQMGIYYLVCPNINCGVINTHPLVNGRGEAHIRACGG